MLSFLLSCNDTHDIETVIATWFASPSFLHEDNDREMIKAKLAKCFQNLVLILLGSGYGMSKKEYITRAIVQALSAGPLAFTELELMLPRWIGEDSSFERILNEVSETSSSHSLLESMKYVLKGDYKSYYSPYYWDYTLKESEKSTEYMNQRFGLLKLAPLSKPAMHELSLSSALHAQLVNLLKVVFCTSGLESMYDDAFELISFMKYLSNEHIYLSCSKELVQRLQNYLQEAAHNVNKQKTSIKLIEDVFSSFKYSTEGNTDSSRTNLKELATQRRQMVQEAIKANQDAFFEKQCSLSKELAPPISAESLNDQVHTAETDTCIYCQEPADSVYKPYGILGFCEILPLSNETSAGQCTLCTCFHMMHFSCYEEARNGEMNSRCPLCGAYANHLFPIPVAPLIQPLSKTVITEALRLPAHNDSENINALIHELSQKCQVKLSVYDFGMESNKDKRSDPLDCMDSIVEMMVQNVRQAFILEGSAEYGHIARIGRLIKCWILDRLHKESIATIFNMPPKSDIEFFLRFLIYSYHQPDRMSSKQWVEVVNLYRAIFLGNTDLYASPRSRDCAFKHAKMFKYLMHVWFEQDFLEKSSLYELLANVQTEDDVVRVAMDGMYAIADDSFFIFCGSEAECEYGKLIKLPDELCDYFAEKCLPRYCKDCMIHKELTQWNICLFCGRTCCPVRSCKSSYLVHTQECRGCLGMFIVPSDCSLILVTDTAFMARIPAPYLDAHGETDLGFR